MTNPIEHAAARLAQAASTGQPCAPVRDLLGETDLAAAYAVQEIGTAAKLSRGSRLVGRKIGLTSKAVQTQLGVNQPDYGMLFSDMEALHGDVIPWAAMMQPKVETEIAFILGRDLPNPQTSLAEVMRAIDYAVVALEIVGSRIAGWNIRITDTIADNASSSHFVLGHTPRRLTEIDLIGCGMSMQLNGAQVSTGKGAACLGSPLNATLWLARTMAVAGRPLLAGDVVLSGALGPMAAVNPGDVAVGSVEGFGSVSIAFGQEFP